VQAEPAQAPQEPPQSIPLSAPLRTPSLQVGSAQVLETHTPLLQSPAPPQPCPVAHRCGGVRSAQGPPQSTAVSLPFRTWSVQAGLAGDEPQLQPAASTQETAKIGSERWRMQMKTAGRAELGHLGLLHRGRRPLQDSVVLARILQRGCVFRVEG
jgi:hypothetical protein